MKSVESPISLAGQSDKGPSFSEYLENLPSLAESSAKQYNIIVKKFRKRRYSLDRDGINSFLSKDRRVVAKFALVHYAKFLGNDKLVGIIKDTKVKPKPKREYSIPTYDEFMKVIDRLDQEERMIATFLINTGARCGEAMNVKYSDIDTKECEIKLEGKGGKRLVRLSESFIQELMHYLKEVKGVLPTESIFYTDSRATSVNKVNQFWFRLNRAAWKAIGRGIQTHDFRRFTAVYLYEKSGGDIMLVKDILGHARIETTAIYTGYADKKKSRSRAAKLLGELQPQQNTTRRGQV